MNPEETEIVKRLRTGKCPHTHKKYNCAHCDWKQEEEPPLKPGIVRKYHGVGMCVDISGYIEENTPKREWNRLARCFTGAVNGEDVRKYFFTLYSLGVKLIPVGKCRDFCFRHGWIRKFEDVEKESK